MWYVYKNKSSFVQQYISSKILIIIINLIFEKVFKLLYKPSNFAGLIFEINVYKYIYVPDIKYYYRQSL